ncbi:DinB family protein [Neobacillus terrae]|uniref:DinB family protein n=1 Tax=Neobacillus terrae TaxID=3034837 RepID=UPI0014096A06|nr:DinB family protein [Neobacillus terrae]NHM33048.1 DinB family protein [Neobacillus terrae]
MIDYRIRYISGYTAKIGDLVSMLEHTRAVTLSGLQGLSKEDLDYVLDESSNTIGSLLMHIASIEFVHQIITAEDRDINEEERREWGTALELGNQAREKFRGYSLDYYFNRLASIRDNTLTLLKTQDDQWLTETKNWENGLPYNHYWMWFHVMEDEINHRGQIRMIKRLLENRKVK